MTPLFFHPTRYNVAIKRCAYTRNSILVTMFRRVSVHICRVVIGCNASTRPRDPSESVYNTAGFRGCHYSLVILPVTMLRNGWTYAEAARGPVPVPRSGGGIAGLASIPPYGEAFPPLAPPPILTPAPTATVSGIAPDGVRVVSLCQ